MNCESRCRKFGGNWPLGKFGINKESAVRHEGGRPFKKENIFFSMIYDLIRCNIALTGPVLWVWMLA